MVVVGLGMVDFGIGDDSGTELGEDLGVLTGLGGATDFGTLLTPWAGIDGLKDDTGAGAPGTGRLNENKSGTGPHGGSNSWVAGPGLEGSELTANLEGSSPTVLTET